MFYAPSYLTQCVDELLASASFRERNPSLARAIRVAEITALAHLDPDLDSLVGDDAELAARELASAERALFWSGIYQGNAVTIQDGAFPTERRANITARARLQAHRDFAASHAFVRFTTADPTPIWVIMSRPPWVGGPPPMVRRRRELNPRRTPRWIR